MILISSVACWLEQIVRERISPSLALTFDPEIQYWKLKCAASDEVITFRQIPALYQLGDSSALPCSSWDVGVEGFKSIEPFLQAPGCEEVHQPLLKLTDSGFHLNYDILGLSYWMLARCEEVNPSEELLDNHRRFPANASHAFRYGYLDRPIVDEWLGILRQVIKLQWPRLPLIQPQFRVMVSHDVDVPSAYAFGRKRSYLKRAALRWLKHHDFIELIKSPRMRQMPNNNFHLSDPFNTFDWLMDLSDEHGISSSFYFICGRSDPKRDAQYEPEYPTIRNLLKLINSRGHLIGLHPSYNTYCCPQAIVDEGSRLRRIAEEESINQSIWGGRMHVLRWKWPVTAYGWEMAKFDYDSTLGYADYPGFRCGTCHPYRMFDPIANHQLNLVEYPLIVMDCSVTSQRYMNLGHGVEAFNYITNLRNRCKLVSGVFTLLWHNNNLTTAEERLLYQSLLH